MKWNKKYNYPSSTRSVHQGFRHYALNNQMLPSVTSIIEMTKTDKEKESLAAWKSRVGEAESSAISREATKRGSEMHSNIEQFLLGKDNLNLFDDEVEKSKSRMMSDLIIEEGLRDKLEEIHGVECVLYYPGPKGFAGSSDLIGMYSCVHSLIDFKQKNSIMKENYDSLQNYYTQLGGYSLAHNKVYGSNISQGVILLATTDLVFQIFRIKDEKLVEYQNKFLERVDQYYELISKK